HGALGGGVCAIRKRIVWLVRVIRKHVPQHDRLAKAGNDLPHDGGRPLCDGWSLGSALELDAAQELSEQCQMNFVGQRQTCAPSAAIAEIAGDPDGPDV